MRWSSFRTVQTKEIIRGKNEAVDPSASLTAESLRSIFVMLEALVYKCVHLKLKKLSGSYRQRTEDYDDRLRQLADGGLISQSVLQLEAELYVTRCEFAHSLRSADNLTYMGLPLRDRWGSRGTRQTRELRRYFLLDVYRFSEALLGVFKPVQHEQIDREVFRSALHDVVRSMREVGSVRHNGD